MISSSPISNSALKGSVSSLHEKRNKQKQTVSNLFIFYPLYGVDIFSDMRDKEDTLKQIEQQGEKK
jgi:hypothetical protein